LTATRLWFIEGLVRRVTIAGPSMAPALCGESYAVICGDCGFRFRCDAEHLPTDHRAACPNCGFADNSLDVARRSPPDRVLIDRWPLLWSTPQRGEVVAVQTTEHELAVKRVAALPGERLAIRDGDLYAGQQLVRKTRAQLTATRLLVHDNAYQPQQTPGLPPRWRAADAASRWKAEEGGFQVEPSAADSEDIDWLEYEHWSCTVDSRSRGRPAAITDNDSYNQGETHRPLNAMSDVLVSCRLRAVGAGQLVFAAVDGEQRFEVEIEPRKRILLRSSGRTLLDRPLRLNLSRQPTEIEFGLCDQQVLLAANGRMVLRYEYERPVLSRSEPLHPLAIGARGIGLQISELRVWRDIYFLDSHGLPRRWQADSPLASDHFALLGDNQPVSIDSRHWEPPGMPRSAILGRVYQPFWARSR